MKKILSLRAGSLLALGALLSVLTGCGGGGAADSVAADAGAAQRLAAQSLPAVFVMPGEVSTRLNQISAERVNRTTYDYKYSVTFTAGATALVNAVGHVSSSDAGTVIIDGDVNIGDLAAGANITPDDSITIRQDLTKGFNSASLAWNISETSVGPLVQLAVTVADSGAPSGTLSYRWKSTDGNIVDVNAPTTTWTLPTGPGLHFAYVLVSNNQGGITERRVAVNTDTIGAPLVIPAPASYDPPAAAVPAGLTTYRSFFGGGDGELPVLDSFGDKVRYETFRPDVLVYMQDTTTGATFPAGGAAAAVRTNLQGQYVIHDVLRGNPTVPADFDIWCSPDNGVSWARCYGHQGESAEFAFTGNISEHIFSEFPIGSALLGRFRLADDAICGTKNEFFATEITAVATLLDASGAAISGPLRLSKDGDYSFGNVANAASVRITCQSATPQVYAVGSTINGSDNLDLGLKVLAGVKAPVVSDMTATLSAVPVGLFLPPPTGFPSDAVPDPERFLSYKGIDSRKSACQYYKAIGAVKDCDANGNLVGAINVEDWRRKVKIGSYATAGTTEYSAVYINQVDLNLTRNQHSISYGPNHTAAYVCNHLGPPSLDSTQAEINTAIDNAVAGKNLVACVMMDSIATPGVNDGKPYTTFLIFGPSGELLPSINLDGRREKFVPGVCVACHGGDKYAGRFPEDGTGGANIGAHFLPYDIGNFAFSDKPGLTRADQELSLYHLNQNLLLAGATPAATELIAGWYAGGSTMQNLNYLPPSWVGQGADDVYHKVYAHSCRTCHVNLQDEYNQYNFDNFDNTRTFAEELSCNNPGYHGQHRKWGMPNSLVTFNRLWNTKGTGNDLTALWAAFLGAVGTPPECKLVLLP